MNPGRMIVLAVVAVLPMAACAGDADPRSPEPTGASETTTTVAAPRASQMPPQTLPLVTLPPGAAVCDAYADITTDGSLTDGDLKEISGVAASRRHAGVLWAHNDSRGGASVYALSMDGTLRATWTLDGVIALDWEDISAGPGPEPGTSYLYVGDIGDNFALRSEIVVYRFPEPDVTSDGVIGEFEVFRLSYPDSGPNAEALAVDPVSGDVVIVTKDRDGPAVVYRAPGMELRDGLPTRLEFVTSLDLGSGAEVTAADISSGGERIALRGYEQVWIWPRVGADLASTFDYEPCLAASPTEVQGEALTFDEASVNLYTISEGTGAAVYQIGLDR